MHVITHGAGAPYRVRVAAEALASEMREYAEADDDAAMDDLPEDAADDDLPSMSAHVEACLRDDPPAEGKDWGYVIGDAADRSISFWLAWTDDRIPGDDD